MSYILDALKRADTERERERGTVPGLHSQNLPSGNSQRDRQRQPSGLPRYTLWAGLLVLILVASWYLWPAEGSQTDTATAPASTPEPAPSATTARMAEEPVATPAAAGPATARAPDLPILAPPPPAPPQPPRAERPQTSSRAATTATEAAQPTAAPAATTASTPADATTQPTTPVRRFAELSPELRAQLPQVNISGSTYSSDPDLRTLIANGKVMQEGDQIAPGLKVETIGQRSAVLNFRGTRYSIGF